MILSSKEKILDYLLSGYLHLSKKDYIFFNNLRYAILGHKPITSNQTALFDKLLLKYKKQFRKNNYEVEELLTTEWKAMVVQSSQEYLTAKVYIEGDDICIRSPFNTKFISNIKQHPLCGFEWNKNEKVYKASLSTYTLKTSLDLVTKNYDSHSTCEKISEILSELQIYKADYWNPTLVKRNDSFYISCLSKNLYEQIENLELNDDPKTLFLLANLGIRIDQDIVKDDAFLRFASEYNTSIDLENVDDLANWLSVLGIDYVSLSRDIVYNKQIAAEIKEKIETIIPCGSNLPNEGNVVRLSFLSTNKFRESLNYNYLKNIFLKNSRPVKIA